MSPTHRTALTWSGLVTVPLLVAGLLAWTFGHGLDSQGSAIAAVVNNDQPVTINGTLVPLGRQLAQTLVHGDDKRYRWVLTDDTDARRGLQDGDYAAVVTIPAEFSRRTTSAATTKQPFTASQGVISVTTSRDAAVADALISKDVADAATAATADQVEQAYLDKIYVGFTTLHGKIGDAATGARKIADGTDQAGDGSRQLVTGTGRLAGGLGTLAKGAGQADAGAKSLDAGAQRLKTGTARLASGATTLSSGTHQLAGGATQLSTGLDTLRTQTAEFPTQTRQLADGAQEVADGNAQLADKVVPMADKVLTALDAIPDLTQQAGKLQELTTSCHLPVTSSNATGTATAPAGSPTLPTDFCNQLAGVTARVQTAASTVDAKKADTRDQTAQLRDGVLRLKDGSAQVADGAQQLAQAAPALASGIAQAADAGRQLATGAKNAAAGATRLAGAATQVATGTTTLATGASSLATGVDRLRSGSTDAATGARKLQSGAGQLASGLSSVERGAGNLAEGLGSSQGQVPTYTAEERDHLKQIAASPAYAQDTGDDTVSRVTGSLFVVLALWVGAMATVLARRAVPTETLTSRASTLVLVARGILPGIAAATASSVALGLGLAIYLQVGVDRLVPVTLATVAAGTAFAVVNQGLAATLGRPGRLAGLGVLVLTAAVGVLATTPTAVKNLDAALPTHHAITAIRTAAIDGAGLGPALLQLLAWAFVGIGATIYVIERRRSVSRRMLRPEPLRDAHDWLPSAAPSTPDA